MVRFSSSLLALCLITSTTASTQRRWTSSDIPTGTTGTPVIEGCEFWANDIASDDSCEGLEAYFDITKEQFLAWNPSVPASCTLVKGRSYCVAGPKDGDHSTITSGITAAAATATDTDTATTTTKPPGTLTYSGTAAPTQSGVASSCKEYYLVKDDDTCLTIQSQFMDFTLQQFYKWNPSISTGCKGLRPGFFVCVSDGTMPTGGTSTLSGTPTESPNGGASGSLGRSSTLYSSGLLTLLLQLLAL